MREQQTNFQLWKPSTTCALWGMIWILLTVAAPSLWASDVLVEFSGHTPHTWNTPVQLRGRLIQPAGTGPFPAVVVKHGSAGMWTEAPNPNLPLGNMKSQFDDWAAMLSQDGYVVLVLDSFGPRGYSTFINKKPPEDSDIAPVYERARDAFDALDYLRGLASVDGDRIAVLGFSHGGGGVAGAMVDANAVEAAMGLNFTVTTSQGPAPGTYPVPRPARPLNGQDGFKCGVSYYPGAAFFSYFGSGSDPNDGSYSPYGPYLMVYGDQDGFWTAGSPLVLQQKAQLAGSSDLEIALYNGVGHSFDSSGTQEAIDARAEVRSYLTDCLSGVVIGDRVWADLDGDGIQDIDEPGIEGVSVQLSSGGSVWQTVTGANGIYRFEGLDAGNFNLSFTVPTGYSAITVGQSVIDAFGETLPFAMVTDQERQDLDAGFLPDGTSAQITGTVWHDDKDGQLELEEPGIEGIQVTLETPSGQVVDQQITDLNGSYAFTSLLPGKYRIRVDADGWSATAEGGDSQLLSGTLETSTLTVGADAQVVAHLGLDPDCFTYPLVSFGSLWRYELNQDPASNWPDLAYDDTLWPEAHGLLGYPASKVYTALPTGFRVTRYFRHTFNVNDPTLISELFLDIERDDGAIVYLNGTEILRSNLPLNTDANTKATNSEWAVDSATPSASLLLSGTNVIAVELHQRWVGGSSDWGFDLELRTKSCAPCEVKSRVLTATKDTNLKQSEPNTSTGNYSTFWTTGKNQAQRAALLHFDVSALPAGSEILGAHLAFDVTSDTSAFYPVYRMDTPWIETEATWNEAEDGQSWTAGTFSSQDVTQVPMGFAHTKNGNGEYALGLNEAGLAQLGAWMSGAANEGLVIFPELPTSDGFAAISKEGGQAPTLNIVYRDDSCNP